MDRVLWRAMTIQGCARVTAGNCLLPLASAASKVQRASAVLRVRSQLRPASPAPKLTLTITCSSCTRTILATPFRFARRSSNSRWKSEDEMIQPFHPDDLKRFRELTYLRSSAEAYFLLGVQGWKFDHSTFRLTPVLLDDSDGPVVELREMYDSFSARNDD